MSRGKIKFAVLRCVGRVCGPDSVVGAREGEWGKGRKRIKHPDWPVGKKLSLSLLILAQRLCSLFPDGSSLKRQ